MTTHITTVGNSLEKPILLNSRTQEDIPVFKLIDNTEKTPEIINNEE